MTCGEHAVGTLGIWARVWPALLELWPKEDFVLAQRPRTGKLVALCPEDGVGLDLQEWCPFEGTQAPAELPLWGAVIPLSFRGFELESDDPGVPLAP